MNKTICIAIVQLALIAICGCSLPRAGCDYCQFSSESTSAISSEIEPSEVRLRWANQRYETVRVELKTDILNCSASWFTTHDGGFSSWMLYNDGVAYVILTNVSTPDAVRLALNFFRESDVIAVEATSPIKEGQ